MSKRERKPNKSWWEKPKITPENIGEILQRWLSQNRIDKGWKVYRVNTAWLQITDEQLQKHTKVTKIRNQVVEILVDSHALHYELISFQKNKLLRSLRQQCKEFYIADLKFKIGDLNSE